MKFLAELMTYTFIIYSFGIGGILMIKKTLKKIKERNVLLKNNKKYY